MKRPKASKVPCGDCTLCCQGDLIFLHKEMGDRVSDYKVRRVSGFWVLQHKPDGDCVYLDREKGCVIHTRRPAICREFDCRGLVGAIGRMSETEKKKYFGSDVLARGRELINQGEDDV